MLYRGTAGTELSESNVQVCWFFAVLGEVFQRDEAFDSTLFCCYGCVVSERYVTLEY